MKTILTIAVLAATSQLLWTQVYFTNASFEGEPNDATVPVGWYPCEPRTTPDILPGVWGVYTEPSEGETFVGLITRENGTWESITQRLSKTLRPGSCYAFSIDLSHSNTYNQYNRFIKLRIWGGARKCGKDQLLLETPLIKHTDWQTYSLQFKPKKPVNYILFEAFYSDRRFSHRGNILLDNLSPIIKCTRALIEKKEDRFISSVPCRSLAVRYLR